MLALVCGLLGPTDASELCLVPSAANGLHISVNCVALVFHANEWVGFRSGGGQPCQCWDEILCVGTPFGWTISYSASEPDANTSSWGIGATELYLWYVCTDTAEGLSSAEFDLAGSMTVLSFTPMNGFLNAGDATHLLLSVGGCPPGPVVAGVIQVSDPTPVDAATWGRIKSTYR
jgi:hypothetical protein